MLGLFFDDTKVLLDVLDERIKQINKWGVQRHPNGTGRGGSVQLADIYRTICQANTAETDNWQDILSEEIYEAYAETEDQALRKELVQCAAVIVSWIETIDARARGEV